MQAAKSCSAQTWVILTSLTAEEFQLMSAGMSFQLIVASLTTNPATCFGYSSHSGRIVKGMDADLVVLDGDPARDERCDRFF
jgi:imidazolonepropionase-like amidohydrolase